MLEFFSKMNDEYAQKHFPSGSVFANALKTTKQRGIIGIFFFVLFFAAAMYVVIWLISRTIDDISNGKSDAIGFDIGVSVFFGLIALGCFFVLKLMIKMVRQGVGDYMINSAKCSQLSVSEIEEFDRQAFASDCYILKLTAGLDRVLSNATNSDGLLTRDYIYLADTAQTVMRVDSLKACFFTDYTYYINNKKIHNLAICLIASNGVSVLSDTTEKAGLALMEILKERNGTIDTNNGNVVPEGKTFDNYKKRVLETL